MTEEQGTQAAAPADDAASTGSSGAPPADSVGAAIISPQDDGGTGVAAGSVLEETQPDQPENPVMLKVEPPYSEFEVIGAVVTSDYSPFTEQQAAALTDAAADAGVTLTNQADEQQGGSGGTASA